MIDASVVKNGVVIDKTVGTYGKDMPYFIIASPINEPNETIIFTQTSEGVTSNVTTVNTVVTMTCPNGRYYIVGNIWSNGNINAQIITNGQTLSVLGNSTLEFDVVNNFTFRVVGPFAGERSGNWLIFKIG